MSDEFDHGLLHELITVNSNLTIIDANLDRIANALEVYVEFQMTKNTAQVEAAPKRKRRTKEEIEADTIIAEDAMAAVKTAAKMDEPLKEVAHVGTTIEQVELPEAAVVTTANAPIGIVEPVDPRAGFSLVNSEVAPVIDTPVTVKSEVAPVQALSSGGAGNVGATQEKALTWGDVSDRMMALLKRDTPSYQDICKKLGVERFGALFDQPAKYAEAMRLIYAAEVKLDTPTAANNADNFPSIL